MGQGPICGTRENVERTPVGSTMGGMNAADVVESGKSGIRVLLESCVGLLNVERAARRLGTSVRHVRRLVAERRVPFVKVGHYVRFDPEDLSCWVAGRRVRPIEE